MALESRFPYSPLSPYQAVGQMLRLVGDGLADWARPLLHSHIGKDNYLVIVRNRVFEFQRDEVPVQDPKFWLDVFKSDYWDGVFQARTDRSQLNRAKKLSRVRNEYAHFEREDVDWARNSLKVAREFLRLLGDENRAAGILEISDRLAAVVTPIDEGYDFSKALAEAGSIAGRQLVLDPEQWAYVKRFRGDAPKGPWLLRGAPGSGKTIVALHAIKELLGGDQQTLEGTHPTLQILYTTYTNSLVAHAEAALRELLTDEQIAQVRIATIDSIARELVEKHDDTPLVALDASDLHHLTWQRLTSLEEKGSGGLRRSDTQFVVDEFDQVIAGRGVTTLEQFLAVQRFGRGPSLGREQRTAIWALYQAVSEARSARWPGKRALLFSEIVSEANRLATPTYDYVFVDEAQDLKPASLSLAVALARVPSNVFVAIDPNQSLYGTAMPWSEVSDRLSFRGRAFGLVRSHRTTGEIWSAVRALADPSDEEVQAFEAMNSGARPVLAWYGTDGEMGLHLKRLIAAAMAEEGIGPDSVVVLCSREQQMTRVKRHLGFELNPRAMKSRNFDVSHPGVKVTTIHAAKGLGFPVAVVIAEPEPQPESGGNEAWAERQRRLLYVASTRTTNRLIVLARRGLADPFFASAGPPHWHIADSEPETAVARF